MTEARAAAKPIGFKETMAARAQNDPAFARAVLDEAIPLLAGGEPESVERILSGRVGATVSGVSGILASFERFRQAGVRARAAMA